MNLGLRFYFIFMVSIATKQEERQQNYLRVWRSHILDNCKNRVLFFSLTGFLIVADFAVQHVIPDVCFLLSFLVHVVQLTKYYTKATPPTICF